jgi:hypothetical protein
MSDSRIDWLGTLEAHIILTMDEPRKSAALEVLGEIKEQYEALKRKLAGAEAMLPFDWEEQLASLQPSPDTDPHRLADPDGIGYSDCEPAPGAGDLTDEERFGPSEYEP